MTPEQKTALADIALELRNEQVEARIVHYKAEMETSPELDAITAQVVSELKQLQAKAAVARPADSEAVIERSLTNALANLLARVYRKDEPSLLVERKLKDVGRRLARLFFESQLHERIAAGQPKAKVIHHAEQGVLYVMTRYDHRLRAELECFEYADPEVRARSLELFAKLTKDLRTAFLARRSPELERLMNLFQQVLLAFFQQELPLQLQELAAHAVRDAGVAKRQTIAYKIAKEQFAAFRQAYEKDFMRRLVAYAEDALLPKLAEGEFREETVQLFTDPRLFSDVCELLCDALYEFLYTEGFLDLPADWRHELREQ